MRRPAAYLRSRLPCICSLLIPKKAAEHFAEPRNFSGNAPTQEKAMTVVIQPKARRNAHGPIRGYVPDRNRSEVVGSVLKAETVAVAEAAVHFQTSRKVLRTKSTAR